MQPHQQQSAATATTETKEEPAILDQVLAKTCESLDRVASRYASAMHEVQGRITRAMILADGIEKLRSMITGPLMDRVMKLQGSKLGFKTDKDKDGGYPAGVVKECLIEALLRGVYPVGNEFNVIVGQCYVTKEGYQRLVREIPGLTDLEESPGTPVLHNGQTVVRYACRWRYQGRRYELTDPEGKPGRVIPIRVNQGLGVDAMLGKAQRKALKAVYEMTLGSDHVMPDGAVDEALSQEVPPTGRMDLRGNGEEARGLLGVQSVGVESSVAQSAPVLADQLAASLAMQLDDNIDGTRNPAELKTIVEDLEQNQERLGPEYDRLVKKAKDKIADVERRASLQGKKR
jgi:hypothetical protein